MTDGRLGEACGASNKPSKPRPVGTTYTPPYICQEIFMQRGGARGSKSQAGVAMAYRNLQCVLVSHQNRAGSWVAAGRLSISPLKYSERLPWLSHAAFFV